MAKEIGEQKAIEPTQPSTSPDADALIESGWRHYSNKEYYRAEEDFKKALDLIPDSADTMYALGMTLQAAGRTDEAISAFGKVFPLLDAFRAENPARALMLNRLVHGHINYMRTGDWSLE